MNTLDRNDTFDTTPVRSVLEETPARALVFLRALGTNPSLNASLASVGYTKADHVEGWTLFLRANGHDELVKPNVSPATQAVAEINAWEPVGFLRAQAALRRRHPEQERFVFADLVAAKGMEAISPLSTFLDRLDELESGAARKSTRKADHAALATLATRGIDAAVRKHLRALLATAITQADAAPHLSLAEAKRQEALVGLYRWLQEWADMARSVLEQRNDLITLGLAKRRKKKAKVQPAPVEPPPPAPIATPPMLKPPAAPAVPVESVDEEGPTSRAA